jgi:hypothetical protein
MDARLRTYERDVRCWRELCECPIDADAAIPEMAAAFTAAKRGSTGHLDEDEQIRESTIGMPKWRNGRRSGFKIRRPKGREGSTPSFGTKNTRVSRLLAAPNRHGQYPGDCATLPPVRGRREHRSAFTIAASWLLVATGLFACGGKVSDDLLVSNDASTGDDGVAAATEASLPPIFPPPPTVDAAGPPANASDASSAQPAFGSELDAAADGETLDAAADATMLDATADVATQDAADDAEVGSPYPAPHPPLPQAVSSGGPVLTTPHVQLIFYPNNANQSALETFAQNLATSTYWATTTAEYGIGPLSYLGSTVLTGQTPPSVIASTDVQTWMGQQIAGGTFGTPDPETIYTLVYPSTTTIQQQNPVTSLLGPVDSCSTFYGYHDSVGVALTDGGAPTKFAYAIIATCTASIDDQTATMSHEWVESSTDPQATGDGPFALTAGPGAAYYSVDSNDVVWEVLASGGEVADLCQPEGTAADYTPADIGYAVQRIWSDRLAAASHDPCAPDLAGLPFFQSAPVLNDMVVFTPLPNSGSLMTKGVTIPVGQSATIEVDLFSDAPTSSPWTVTAGDLLSRNFASYGVTPTLSFAWDQTQGSNGDKLHLTITVTGASLFGGAHAFFITSTRGSRYYEWPGVVVE